MSSFIQPLAPTWKAVKWNQKKSNVMQVSRKNSLASYDMGNKIQLFLMCRNKRIKAFPARKWFFFFCLTADLSLKFLCNVSPSSRSLWKPSSWSWYEQGFSWDLTLCCCIQFSVAAAMLEISIALHTTASAQEKQSINSCSVYCIFISKAFYVKNETLAAVCGWICSNSSLGIIALKD